MTAAVVNAPYTQSRIHRPEQPSIPPDTRFGEDMAFFPAGQDKDGLLQLYLERREGAEILHGDSASKAAQEAKTRGEVSDWFRTSGQSSPSVDGDTAISNLCEHLWERYSDNGVLLLELEATILGVATVRAFNGEHGRDPLPVDGLDITAVLPALRHLLPRDRERIVAKLPLYFRQFPTSRMAERKTGFNLEWVRRVWPWRSRDFQTSRGLGSATLDAVAGRLAGDTPDQLQKRERVTDDGHLRVVYPNDPINSSESGKISAQFLANRLDFVKRMHWLPNAESDKDPYDIHPATAYILRSDSSNPEQLQAGMRLTRIGHSQESLTWTMMKKNPLMQQAVEVSSEFDAIAQAADRGELWDLTRLVPAESALRAPASTLRDVYLDLFGAGVGLTSDNETKNPAWIFLTTPSVYRFLQKNGIDAQIITRGLVTPGDTKESYFCVVYPKEVVRRAVTSQEQIRSYTGRRLQEAAKSLSFNIALD